MRLQSESAQTSTRINIDHALLGYRESFPPKRMNVRIERRNVPDGNGSSTFRDVLVATTNFKAGDEIYTVNCAMHL